MANEIAEAIRSARSLTARLKELNGLEEYGDLLAAAAALQEQLSDALVVNAAGVEEKMALLQRVEQLSKENAAFHNWAATAKDYVLQDLGFGAFAQVYKPAVDAGKARHWVCTKCFEDHVATVLQKVVREGYACPRCGLKISKHAIQGDGTINSAYG